MKNPFFCFTFTHWLTHFSQNVWPHESSSGRFRRSERRKKTDPSCSWWLQTYSWKYQFAMISTLKCCPQTALWHGHARCHRNTDRSGGKQLPFLSILLHVPWSFLPLAVFWMGGVNGDYEQGPDYILLFQFLALCIQILMELGLLGPP